MPEHHPATSHDGLVVILDDGDPMGEPLDAMARRAVTAGHRSIRAIRRHLRGLGVCARNQAMERAARCALRESHEYQQESRS
jgi:hypothetical protein